MTTTIDNRFFRAGVGTVIYNTEGKVAMFERAKHPVGVWQFQQGGIDLGEDIETTLWRELREEIRLTTTDFVQIDLYPKWTVYQDPNSVHDPLQSRFGQAHRWYFLQLKDSVTIDLSKALEEEACDYKWITFSQAIAETDELKKHVYQELATYFLSHIQAKI